MVTRQQAEYEWCLPSDSGRAYPLVFSTCCDGCGNQWRGCSQRHSGFRKQLCGCSWHHDEQWEWLDLCLLQVPSWSGKLALSNGHHSNDRTHVKNLNNLVEVQFPSGHFFLVVFCVETSRNRISFSLHDDIPFDLPYSPGVEWKPPLTTY